MQSSSSWRTHKLLLEWIQAVTSTFLSIFSILHFNSNPFFKMLFETSRNWKTRKPILWKLMNACVLMRCAKEKWVIVFFILNILFVYMLLIWIKRQLDTSRLNMHWYETKRTRRSISVRSTFRHPQRRDFEETTHSCISPEWSEVRVEPSDRDPEAHRM